MRKLLRERVSSGQIAALMEGRSTQETERMFLGGVEGVSQHGAGEPASGAAAGTTEAWMRVAVAPGIELHLRDDVTKVKEEELRSFLYQIEGALRRFLPC